MPQEIRYYFDLITALTKKEVKGKYKSTYLGYFWSLLQPLAFALVFFVAFKTVMRIQIEDYLLFLIAGLFPWQWLSNSVNASPLIFLSNASLIKKVSFPRSFVVISQITQEMIHFILSIPIVVLFIFIYEKDLYLSWLWGIPILLVIQFTIVYGLCLIISSLNLFFRDLEKLTNIAFSMIFYLTPILYSETMIPQGYQRWLTFNPFSHLIISWRSLFLHGVTDWPHMLVSFCFGIGIMLMGYLVYRNLSWKFAEVV